MPIDGVDGELGAFTSDPFASRMSEPLPAPSTNDANIVDGTFGVGPTPSERSMSTSSSSSAMDAYTLQSPIPISSGKANRNALFREPSMVMMNISPEAVSIKHLSMHQRKCLASIVACLLPHQGDQEFSVVFFASLLAFLELGEQAVLFNPLLRSENIDPVPFVEDMELTEIADRGRALVMILTFATFSFEKYDSRCRVLLRTMANSFGVSWQWMIEEELVFIAVLRSDLKASSFDRQRTRKSWMKVGAAVAISTTLFVVTGGIIAPALGAGLGALGVGAGAFFGTAAGTALVSGLFGATGAGLAGYKMNRRVRNIRQFQFTPLSDVPDRTAMEVTICITGIMDDKITHREVWSSVAEHQLGEPYVLEWETDALIEAGQGIRNFATFQVGGQLVQETLKQTFLYGVMSALALPSALISASYLIDNPWSLVVGKADQAGLLLADALLANSHGHRPVTLVGFSVGARVIVQALLEMAKFGESSRGIIQDVFLLGCPDTANLEQWTSMQTVVAGRFVNAYSRSDWVLKYLFRAAAPTLTVCGLAPVLLDSVENIDLTAIIDSHSKYLTSLSELLEVVQFSSA